MLFLKCWDVAFLLWFPSAGLPVGKAFCSLSFSLSSLCPSLVWMYALFIEFSRRWFRRELLAMTVSVLEVLCYGPCVWLLQSQKLCGAATVSLECIPEKLWTFNYCLFVFRSRLSSGLGPRGGTSAEPQMEQPCQLCPHSCLALFLFLVSCLSWVLKPGQNRGEGAFPIWEVMINDDEHWPLCWENRLFLLDFKPLYE